MVIKQNVIKHVHDTECNGAWLCFSGEIVALLMKRELMSYIDGQLMKRDSDIEIKN